MTWPSQGRQRTRTQRKARLEVLAAAHGRCQINGPTCTGEATEDDHIIPLAEGGSEDRSNHQAACHNCNAWKAQQEAARGRARAAAKAKQPKRKHPGLR